MRGSNVRLMYLRPGNLFKKFMVESVEQIVDSMGRPKERYVSDGRFLVGALADASDNDREKWKQLQHPITHTIVQAGKPMAKAEDRLVLGERTFYIHAVDDCGSLGVSTIYYAEERGDLK